MGRGRHRGHLAREHGNDVEGPFRLQRSDGGGQRRGTRLHFKHDEGVAACRQLAEQGDPVGRVRTGLPSDADVLDAQRIELGSRLTRFEGAADHDQLMGAGRLLDRLVLGRGAPAMLGMGAVSRRPQNSHRLGWRCQRRA